MPLEDYAERESFTPQEMEHILQLPLSDLVEFLAAVPRAGGGRYQGDGCRALVRKLGRGRLFADLVARQSVNAEPVIRRGPETGDPDRFLLRNETTGEEFTVRFSGDLHDYLEANRPVVEESTPEPPSSDAPDPPDHRVPG